MNVCRREKIRESNDRLIKNTYTSNVGGIQHTLSNGPNYMLSMIVVVSILSKKLQIMGSGWGSGMRVSVCWG